MAAIWVSRPSLKGILVGAKGQKIKEIGMTARKRFEELTGEEIIYRNYKGGEVKHPKTDMDVPPRVPFGEAKKPDGDIDRRATRHGVPGPAKALSASGPGSRRDSRRSRA